MLSWLYVKKIVLTFFVLSVLTVSFIIPVSCATSETISDSRTFDLYSIQNQATLTNVYSITRFSNSDSLVILDSPVTNGTTRTYFCLIALPSNFLDGQLYTFNCSISPYISSTPFYLDQFSYALLDQNQNIVAESPLYTTYSQNVFWSSVVSSSVRYLAISCTGHTENSTNRFRFVISPITVTLSNSADLGGSFDDSVPTIPDIDISQDISRFDGANNDIISVLTDNWTNISTYVQHYALFFSFLWSQFNVHSPIVTRLIITILSFGSLAMILNIFGYAKSQGSNSSVSHDSGKKGGDKN